MQGCHKPSICKKKRVICETQTKRKKRDVCACTIHWNTSSVISFHTITLRTFTQRIKSSSSLSCVLSKPFNGFPCSHVYTSKVSSQFSSQGNEFKTRNQITSLCSVPLMAPNTIQSESHCSYNHLPGSTLSDTPITSLTFCPSYPLCTHHGSHTDHPAVTLRFQPGSCSSPFLFAISSTQKALPSDVQIAWYYDMF